MSVRSPLRAALALAGVVVALQFGSPYAAAASAPFSDSNAIGQLTLCGTDGKPVTSGSTNAVPFVWRAVGSTAAKSPYNGAGRTAALYAYQAIQNVDPYEWNGDALTAYASYTNASHPMAAATPADLALSDWMTSYPLKWDGLVQLRMFTGVPREPTWTQNYNAAIIKVSGSTWTLVQGGGGDCSSGTAVSAEVQLVPSIAALPTPGVSASARASSGSASASAGGSSSGASTGSSGGSESASASDSSGATGESSSAHQSSSSSSLPWILGVVVVLLAAGSGGFVWWRKRSAVSP